jgi:hypothetical protein
VSVSDRDPPLITVRSGTTSGFKIASGLGETVSLTCGDSCLLVRDREIIPRISRDTGISGCLAVGPISHVRDLGPNCDDQEGDHAGFRPSRPSVWSSAGASEATGTAGPKAWPRAA